ncbi:MAG TPA: hypothetical protein VFE40_05305, partial [Jatrophihabitantaceae bacterium]|nr:hypothetical protein [Jatrophihabitantaceae bacterium]
MEAVVCAGPPAGLVGPLCGTVLVAPPPVEPPADAELPPARAPAEAPEREPAGRCRLVPVATWPAVGVPATRVFARERVEPLC